MSDDGNRVSENSSKISQLENDIILIMEFIVEDDTDSKQMIMEEIKLRLEKLRHW